MRNKLVCLLILVSSFPSSTSRWASRGAKQGWATKKEQFAGRPVEASEQSSDDSSGKVPSVIPSGSGATNTNDLVLGALNFVSSIGAAILWANMFKGLIRGADELLSRLLVGGNGGPGGLSNNSSVALGPDSALAHFLPNVTLSSYELEIAAALIDPEDISTEFRDMGGLRDVKRSLLDSTLSMVSHVEGLGGQPTQGILLYGPPGCGKSALARALAKQRNVPIVPLMPSSVLRKYVGETSLLTRAVFSLCSKLEPCILLIDEADSIFRARLDEDNSVDRTLKTEIMQLWDELIRSEKRVLVIGCTNRPQDLDPAIQRRFERSFLIGLPDEQARVEVFREVLRTTVLDATFDLSQCAKATEGYSPSDILSLCKVAAQIPVREFMRKQRKGGGNGGEESCTTVNPALGDKVEAEALDAGGPRKPFKTRPLQNQDIAEAAQTVYPTGWTSSAYNSVMRQSGGAPSVGMGQTPSNPPKSYDAHFDNYSGEDEDDEDDGH